MDVPVATTEAEDDHVYAEIADNMVPEEYEAMVSSQAESVTYRKTAPDQPVGGYQAMGELDSKSVYTLPDCVGGYQAMGELDSKSVYTLPDCVGGYQAMGELDSKSVYTLPKQSSTVSQK